MMKRFELYVIAAIAVLGVSCSETVETVSGYGSIAVEWLGSAEVAMKNITTHQEGRVEIEGITLPSADDFSLTITDSEGVGQNWSSISEFRTEEHFFEEGIYTVKIASGDVEREGYGMPCFEGERTVRVDARGSATARVTAHIVNALVRVECSGQFADYFTSAAFTLTTAAGNVFEMPMMTEELLYIRPQSLSIDCTAVKQTGEEVALPTQTFYGLKPQTRYTVRYDVAQAGAATVRIVLDDTLVGEAEIDAELNDNALPY